MQFSMNELMAIHPDWACELAALESGQVPPEKHAAPTPYGVDAAGGKTDSPSSGLIAVVPVYGPLSPTGRYGTSLDDLPRVVRSLDRNPQVSDIVLDIRSPGGTVVGTPEAADAVREVRDNKQTRIVSLANGMMASAATWIGTSAEKVYITPSGEAGSIGVISMYGDYSKMYEKFGIKVDVMRVPARKARYTGLEPLSDEMRADMETSLKSAYNKFLAAMARNRGVGVLDVESRFGGGEMMEAQEAVEAGLVDGIMTLDQLLSTIVAERRVQRAPSSARMSLAKAELDLVS